MKIISTLLLIVSLFCLPAYALDYFQNESAAQKHCPNDKVVWLNIPTGIFHFKGQRWYGNTKSGAYVCMEEAKKAGERATRNNQ